MISFAIVLKFISNQVAPSSNLQKLPAAMSLQKLNKITGLEPQKEILEEQHQGPSKTLKETVELLVRSITASQNFQLTPRPMNSSPLTSLL